MCYSGVRVFLTPPLKNHLQHHFPGRVWRPGYPSRGLPLTGKHACEGLCGGLAVNVHGGISLVFFKRLPRWRGRLNSSDYLLGLTPGAVD